MFGLEGLFEQTAAVLVVTVVLGLVAGLLRQPLIIAFIAAGILVGPQVLGLVEAADEVRLLAQVGISVLLFLVGLRLDVRQIKVIGPVALATGLGQVAFTSGVGFVIALGLGFAATAAAYIAIALTFSSTIIIVKLLSDKRELDELHGRIAIGFLIVQDIVVVVAMIGLTAIDATGEAAALEQALGVALRGVLLVAGLAALMRWVLPGLTHRMARQPELLVLFSIAWAVALAAVTAQLGFSEEVGAFLAGVGLASTPYREAIGGRLTAVRDFLLLFFFIEIGATLELSLAGEQLGAALALSLFVLVGNPLIVMAIMGAMRYRARVSFLAGLTVAQISEFSLILAALGRDLGHIGPEVVGLITTVGLVTIAISTYLISNSKGIYERIAPALSIFERREPREGPLLRGEEAPEPRIIVIGLGRLGRRVVERLRDRDVPLLGVDFDPFGVREWRSEDVPVAYGDAEDPELPSALPLGSAEWVVCTIRQRHTNLTVLHAFRHHGFHGNIAVAAGTELDAEELQEAGADLVIRPYHAAAEPVVAELLGDAPDDRADQDGPQ